MEFSFAGVANAKFAMDLELVNILDAQDVGPSTKYLFNLKKIINLQSKRVKKLKRKK